eukprot:m.130063 g.130063  ORF g.130063 m.130063 type:complete len:218 (-) comp22365_c0_seq2:1200-1853(-)
MIIANQRNPNAGDGRQDKPEITHDVAMATMLAPLCGDRTAQMLVPLPPINENPESEKAVSASIETCLILMAMNDQESMSISADLGLMTRLAPVVWGSSTLKKKLWVLPGMWHISQNYLAGMGKKVENSGVDAALTDAEVYCTHQQQQRRTALPLGKTGPPRGAGTSGPRSRCKRLGRITSMIPAAPLSDDTDEADRDKAVQEFDVWDTKSLSSRCTP